MLLITAFVSYMGCFTKSFRLELMDKMWLPFIKTQKVSCKEFIYFWQQLCLFPQIFCIYSFVFLFWGCSREREHPKTKLKGLRCYSDSLFVYPQIVSLCQITLFFPLFKIYLTAWFFFVHYISVVHLYHSVKEQKLPVISFMCISS